MTSLARIAQNITHKEEDRILTTETKFDVSLPATPVDAVSRGVITPDVAAAWLERNTHNRPLRAAHVAALASDMENGDWMFTGGSVRFSADGVLLDGQHTLSAVVQSGCPIESLVVTGLSDKAQAVIDTGATRKFRDQLELAGEANSTIMAAITRSMVLWDRGYEGALGQDGRANHKPTHPEMIAYLEDNPVIRDAASVGESVRKQLPALGGTIAGTAYVLFSRHSTGSAMEFFVKLRDGLDFATKGDPILVLRRYFERAFQPKPGRGNTIRENGASTATPRVKLALVVKAWNAVREGREITQLRFTRKEAFPEPL